MQGYRSATRPLRQSQCAFATEPWLPTLSCNVERSEGASTITMEFHPQFFWRPTHMGHLFAMPSLMKSGTLYSRSMITPDTPAGAGADPSSLHADLPRRRVSPIDDVYSMHETIHNHALKISLPLHLHRPSKSTSLPSLFFLAGRITLLPPKSLQRTLSMLSTSFARRRS